MIREVSQGCRPCSRAVLASQFKTVPSRQLGFTLVEVVVALTLLSLLLVATVTAMRTLGNTKESVSVVSTRASEIRSVSRFLRNALESVSAPQSAGGLTMGGGLSVGGDSVIEGTQNELIWKAPLMFGQDVGGTYELRLVQEDSRLVLYWRDSVIGVDGEARPWSGAPKRELLNGVQEFTLQYRPFDDEPWQSEWQDQRGNPRAVSLQIKANDRFWPQLVVSPPQ